MYSGTGLRTDEAPDEGRGRVAVETGQRKPPDSARAGQCAGVHPGGDQQQQPLAGDDLGEEAPAAPSESGSAQCASSKITNTAPARVRASTASARAANSSGRDANRPGSSRSAVPKRVFSTWVQGQYDGMSADEQRPHATSKPDRRTIASTASARLVLPIPASPAISATRPRPAPASAASSASAVSSGLASDQPPLLHPTIVSGRPRPAGAFGPTGGPKRGESGGSRISPRRG